MLVRINKMFVSNSDHRQNILFISYLFVLPVIVNRTLTNVTKTLSQILSTKQNVKGRALSTLITADADMV